jgi:CRISPR-associated protein Csd1
MSALASLVHAYDRLAESEDMPTFGYSTQNIHACIILNTSGDQVGAPAIWDLDKKGKPASRPMNVPYFGGRSGSKAPPYFLWDNTAYVLGVSGKENFDPLARHDAFVKYHLDALDGVSDEALRALSLFLTRWTPEQFYEAGFSDDLKDRNLVFRLESERGFVHERPAAQALWDKLNQPDVVGEGICLISGRRSQIARLHPPIVSFKNPARIVSFDKDNDAFASYGKLQGANAPTSIQAAFAYTAVLNRFLSRDSGHRVQIGDASTVFWADASDAAAADEAENIFASFVDEKVEVKKVGVILEAIRQGKPIAEVKPDLPQGVRFYVLGLSPNAARLSVRFYIEADFGEIATRYLAHLQRMRLDPPPKEDAPSMWRLLIETASQRKSENIPPNLAGEWLRAILTGAPYPLTLLSTLLMRLRADHDVNALRGAILKSVLIRNFEMEVPVSLDPENKDSGYLLGRLFATYEYAQTQALGGNINATIRDQYYGTASATPRAIFPLLQRKATHHLSRLRKDKPGLATNLDRKIGEIFELAEPECLP